MYNCYPGIMLIVIAARWLTCNTISISLVEVVNTENGSWPHQSLQVRRPEFSDTKIYSISISCRPAPIHEPKKILTRSVLHIC
jgi:hypothetical protein